ncbi:MAG: histidine kinase [Bacteroidetes bacterium]|nr:histidine kinase [Bacteroidota bacterium]
MRIRDFIFFLFIFSAEKISAQQYNFRNYSVADGLAQSQVYAMAEDPRGYLWLGTRGGGLSRFDGQQFRTFNEDDGLPSAFIDCIRIDKKGNIWIGTDEGACWYDGEQFHALDFSGTRGQVNDFYFSDDGKAFIATNDSGVVVLKDNSALKRIYYNHGLPTNRVYCICGGNNNELWFGTEQGAVKYVNDKTIFFGKQEGFPVLGYRAIITDEQHRILFGTYGAGIIILSDSGVSRFGVDDGLSNNSVQCMIKDNANRIWVGTPSGVTRISGNEMKQFSEREGLCSNVVMSLLVDSWGNTWFGTSGGGACVLDGERFIHFNEKSGDMGTWVYAVHCDKKGHTWFGTSRGGATEYDGTYYTNYYEGAGFTTFKIKSFAEDTSGTIWFGTVGDGAYSLQNNSFRHYAHSDGLSSNFVNSILIDSLGRTWFATAGGGISIYDPRTETYTRIGNKQGLRNPRINFLESDRDGNIWACSQGSGIYLMKYDSSGTSVAKNFTTSKGLASDMVRSATCDLSGKMWFGTAGGGISRYDAIGEGGNYFRNFTRKDSLASDNIYLLITDHSGNIWSGTEKGLDKIALDANGNFLSLKHYGKGEGLSGIEVSTNAACVDSSGHVWFGTINGASVYHPENDYVTHEAPLVHFTGIKLFFDPIENTEYGKGKRSDKWFPLPDSLVLPYSQNHLRFEFTGIDLRNPEGVRFRWKLSGFEKNWTPENTERQATYSNLAPGDYTFELQAKNSDGYWSAVKRFSFHITPPVWATWPFRIGVSLLAVLLVLIVFSWRVRIIKRKAREKVQKLSLEKNILELEQKALRLQMNPHFIFNALQSIQGFIAGNDPAEARKYLAKFGKLMRITLENSRTAYTSIAQEAESLEYYLGLEALCHGNRFSFSIETDPKIDPEAVFIPVMLIQPFVENAVIHGMNPLEANAACPTGSFGRGKIIVRFLRKDDSVICEVEDNGVGREKAAAFESEMKKDHKSAALEITRERLSQANEGKTKSKLEIIDLKDENGFALGTKVVITIGNVVFE